jgi:hypothetical protein
MELRYENLRNKPKAFRAFTGFDVEEFQMLLKAFTAAWEKYVQQNRLPTELRQRRYGGGRKTRLGTCQEKLLFILDSVPWIRKSKGVSIAARRRPTQLKRDSHIGKA